MEYKIKEEDLDKCFKFAVEYHLDKTKMAANRTTGQYRGLGGIFDSFVIGKLIEIGVAKIIEKETKKKCILDFDIHELSKDNISDPDIVKIVENNNLREPNLYVEIKNISEADRWIGLTAEQFNTILSDRLVDNKTEKVILIYATLLTKNKEGDIDPLGVYLKSKIDLDLLKKFCEVGDLIVKVQYIITGNDLQKHGVPFNQGSYLYETELIKEASGMTTKKILSDDNPFEKLSLKSGKFPVIMSNNLPKPKEFGSFDYKGDIDVYLKKNYKNGKLSSQRLYIHAKNNAVIKNKVLGTFDLEKGKVYECWFITVGMNPSLKRNNIWIAQRNLNNVIIESPKQYIEKIRKQI